MGNNFIYTRAKISVSYGNDQFECPVEYLYIYIVMDDDDKNMR